MNKSNQQFDDLLKVPDEAIIKSQQIEIGKLNAYIEELEFKISGSKHKLTESKVVDYMNQTQNIQRALDNKKKESSKLQIENIDLKKKIREYAYCERFLKEY